MTGELRDQLRLTNSNNDLTGLFRPTYNCCQHAQQQQRPDLSVQVAAHQGLHWPDGLWCSFPIKYASALHEVVGADHNA